MAAEQKAIPVPDERTKPYWDAAKEGKFILQRCTGCGLWNATPRVICPRCHASDFAWEQPSGKGIIHSYAIVHQTTAAGFQDEVPYVIAHIIPDEEPTAFIDGNILIAEADFDKLNIDVPVVVTFEKRGDITVPQWKLA